MAGFGVAIEGAILYWRFVDLAATAAATAVTTIPIAVKISVFMVFSVPVGAVKVVVDIRENPNQSMAKGIATKPIPTYLHPERQVRRAISAQK
jgi:hypothetical protein